MSNHVDRKAEYLFLALSLIFIATDVILIVLADKMIVLLGGAESYRVSCSVSISLTFVCALKWFFLWVGTSGTR